MARRKTLHQRLKKLRKGLRKALRPLIRTRQRRRRTLAAVVFAMFFALLWWQGGHGPTQVDDLCQLFDERPDWYRSVRHSARIFGVSEAVQMAILHQESGFQPRARPPRKRILWIFPGPRPSTAYGFAQALDSTWEHYQERTGRTEARRDHFDDVAQFVGWYVVEIHETTGIPKDDVANLYLAYHEGPGGYLRGTYREKAWLLDTATRVEQRAANYEAQLEGCRGRLERWPLGPLVLILGFGFAVWLRFRRSRRGRRRGRR